METPPISIVTDQTREQEVSCTPGLSRKEFLEKVLKRAGETGTLVIAATLIDKFQPLPAMAAASEAP